MNLQPYEMGTKTTYKHINLQPNKLGGDQPNSPRTLTLDSQEP
jgi:hypothetical protein